MPVACFQAVGESFKFKMHSVRMWMAFEFVRSQKTVDMIVFLEKSYKNTCASELNENVIGSANRVFLR